MQIKKNINSVSFIEYTDNRTTIASGKNSISTTVMSTPVNYPSTFSV